MILKTEIDQNYCHYLEFSAYRVSYAGNKINKSSHKNSSAKIKLSIEALMEKAKPVKM